MKPAAPAPRSLATTLIAHEKGEAHTPEEMAAAAEKAWGKLRTYLSRVLGTAGFHALQRHSLARAKNEFAWLNSVHLEMDGSLKGLRGAVEGLTPAETFEGFVVLLAHFLQVLASLIGVKLTLCLVQRVWSELDLKEAEPGWEVLDFRLEDDRQ